MNIDLKKDYWFALKSYTYVSFKNNANMLLYNTQTGAFIESSSLKLRELISSIHERKNLGVILLSSDNLKDKEYYYFVKEICDKDIGDILQVNDYTQKPIRLMPVLNIQKDVDKLKKTHGRYPGEEAMIYINNLVIYINNQCKQECTQCSTYFNQFNYCTKNEKENIELSIETLNKIVDQITFSPVSSIQIIGGNILQHSKFHEIIHILPEYIKIHYWIHYLNFVLSIDDEKILSINNKNLLITFPLNNRLFKQALEYQDEHTSFYFIIENIEQFQQTEYIIEKYGIRNHHVHPFYNGNNLSFFKDYIYLSKEDIFSEPLDQRKIFCNQALNSNYFGSLTIFSDGTVSASNHSKPLGNIHNDLLIDIIAKELEENTAWRKTRSNEPCNSCLYQYLCPPPSNYEHALGKLDLCTVTDD